MIVLFLLWLVVFFATFLLAQYNDRVSGVKVTALDTIVNLFAASIPFVNVFLLIWEISDIQYKEEFDDDEY